jgi:hypothetical protein
MIAAGARMLDESGAFYGMTSERPPKHGLQAVRIRLADRQASARRAAYPPMPCLAARFRFHKNRAFGGQHDRFCLGGLGVPSPTPSQFLDLSQPISLGSAPLQIVGRQVRTLPNAQCSTDERS